MEVNYQQFSLFLFILTVLAVIYLIGRGFSSKTTVQGCPVLKTCGPDEKIYQVNV